MANPERVGSSAKKNAWAEGETMSVMFLGLIGLLLVPDSTQQIKENQALLNTPPAYTQDINNDGRPDKIFTREFGGAIYVSLPNGKWDKCKPEDNLYHAKQVVSEDGNRIYTTNGWLFDNQNDKIVNMRTGRGIKLTEKF